MSRCQERNPLTGQQCILDYDAIHKGRSLVQIQHETEDGLIW